MTEKKDIKLRKFKGIVVSDAMDKSIVVQVDALKMHDKYKKQYKTSSRYTVHDEKNQYKVGDVVMFAECRPLSKTKRWRVIY